jgi:hypothetical protein
MLQQPFGRVRPQQRNYGRVRFCITEGQVPKVGGGADEKQPDSVGDSRVTRERSLFCVGSVFGYPRLLVSGSTIWHHPEILHFWRVWRVRVVRYRSGVRTED